MIPLRSPVPGSPCARSRPTPDPRLGPTRCGPARILPSLSSCRPRPPHAARIGRVPSRHVAAPDPPGRSGRNEPNGGLGKADPRITVAPIRSKRSQWQSGGTLIDLRAPPQFGPNEANGNLGKPAARPRSAGGARTPDHAPPQSGGAPAARSAPNEANGKLGNPHRRPIRPWTCAEGSQWQAGGCASRGSEDPAACPGPPGRKWDPAGRRTVCGGGRRGISSGADGPPARGGGGPVAQPRRIG